MSRNKRDNGILTLKELADFLRVHPSTIYRLLKVKSLPAFKIGTDWRFSEKEIQQWVEDRVIKVK